MNPWRKDIGTSETLGSRKPVVRPLSPGQGPSPHFNNVRMALVMLLCNDLFTRH